MCESSSETTRLLGRLRAGEPSALPALIDHACGRLRSLSNVMLRDYPTLRNLTQTDEVLNGAVLRLSRALRNTQPGSSKHFYNVATQHIRWELKELLRYFR